MCDRGESMCVSKTLPTVREILNADSTVGMIGCVSEWTPVTGVDTVHLAWAVRALSGNISVEPVIQYAKVRTDRPGDWNTVGATALTADGDGFVSVDTSTLSAQMFFFRVGLRYTENSGSGHADCRLATSYHCVGKTVASRTLELSSDDGVTRYIPITGVLPTVGTGKVKAAFMLSGGLDVGYGLAVRTFTSDDEEGGSYTNLGSMVDPTASGSYQYAEDLVADTAMSLSGSMYYQLAVRVDNNGVTSGNGYGLLTVLAAVRS